MATEYIYRKNVPVYLDGEDFGIKATLYRDRDVNYNGIPDYFGHIAFTFEQALALARLVNSNNDIDDPTHDYMQGSFDFDPSADMWTEYNDDDGTEVYDQRIGFDAEDGTHLYAICADWCWTLEKVD